MKPELEFCTRIIEETGAILLHHFKQTHLIRSKTTAIDLVTEADELAQEYITRHIRTTYPHHGIIAEEGNTRTAQQDYIWYIDPIDGTTNYWHGIPYFAISMALCHHGDPILGIVSIPATGEMFHACRGSGAYHHHTPIHVSSTSHLNQSLIATGFPYHRAPGTDNNLIEFGRVMPWVQGIRRFGAAAIDMANVAAGRLDGYWEFHVRPWDTMAGQLLVLEAGGEISPIRDDGDLHGAGGILATNGYIHTALHRLIKGEEANEPTTTPPL